VYWGHEFDLSGSRDVIGHASIRLAIGNPIGDDLETNGLQDIQWRMSRNG